MPSGFSIEKSLLLAANWYPLLISVFIVFFLEKASYTKFKSTQKLITLFLCLAGFLYSTTVPYFLPGNADHHSLQTLMWCIAVWIVLDNKISYVRAVMLGLAMGVWVWISPEALPLTFLIYTILGYSSFKQKEYADFSVITSLTLALTTLLALPLEYPASEILSSIHYDTLSIVHVVLFSLSAVGFLILKLHISNQSSLQKQIFLSGLTALSLAFIFLALFPKFIKGPMADVDPYILTGFLPTVTEAKSVFKTYTAITIGLLYLPILAFALSLFFHKKEPKVLALLIIPLVMTCFEIKWAYYLETISFIAIAKFLPTYVIDLRRKHRVHALILSPYVALICIHVMAIFQITHNPIPENNSMACASSAFKSIQSGKLVETLGTAPITIETNIWGNSGVAFFTPYHYISSNYHREGTGMKVKDAIFNSPTLDAVRPYLKERGVSALLICPDTNKQWTYSYFNGTPPKLDWVKIDKNFAKLQSPKDKLYPILLRINP